MVKEIVLIIFPVSNPKRLKEKSLIYDMEKVPENFPVSNPKRLKEKSLIYDMEKVPEKKSNQKYNSMENLTKSELMKIILEQNKNVNTLTKKVNQLIDLNQKLIKRIKKPVPAPRTKIIERPIPTPRTKIMKPPIPTPRKNVKQMVTEYEENIITPVPPPRTKVKQVDQALKGFTKSFEINIIDEQDPLVQLKKTRRKLGFYIKNILESMKGLKFVETLKVTFEKDSGSRNSLF